jgi:hypothetical protein
MRSRCPATARARAFAHGEMFQRSRPVGRSRRSGSGTDRGACGCEPVFVPGEGGPAPDAHPAVFAGRHQPVGSSCWRGCVDPNSRATDFELGLVEVAAHEQTRAGSNGDSERTVAVEDAHLNARRGRIEPEPVVDRDCRRPRVGPRSRWQEQSDRDGDDGDPRDSRDWSESRRVRYEGRLSPASWA